MKEIEMSLRVSDNIFEKAEFHDKLIQLLEENEDLFMERFLTVKKSFQGINVQYSKVKETFISCLKREFLKEAILSAIFIDGKVSDMLQKVLNNECVKAQIKGILIFEAFTKAIP